MDVFGGNTEAVSGSEQSGVGPDGAERPHLTVRPPCGPEHAVQDPIHVSDDVELEVQMVAVCRQTLRCGEGDDGDSGVTEQVEVVAHGDHMLLARQSSEVSMKDQHEGPAAHRTRAPRPVVVIDKFDVRQSVADDECHAAVQTSP